MTETEIIRISYRFYPEPKREDYPNYNLFMDAAQRAADKRRSFIEGFTEAMKYKPEDSGHTVVESEGWITIRNRGVYLDEVSVLMDTSYKRGDCPFTNGQKVVVKIESITEEEPMPEYPDHPTPGHYGEIEY